MKTSQKEPCECSKESEPRLQSLVPIAVAIAAGCERCAEATVVAALQSGSSTRHVELTLKIVETVREKDCFAGAVGQDTLDRMQKPLAAARAVLGNRPGRRLHP